MIILYLNVLNLNIFIINLNLRKRTGSCQHGPKIQNPGEGFLCVRVRYLTNCMWKAGSISRKSKKMFENKYREKHNLNQKYNPKISELRFEINDENYLYNIILTFLRSVWIFDVLTTWDICWTLTPWIKWGKTETTVSGILNQFCIEIRWET